MHSAFRFPQFELGSPSARKEGSCNDSLGEQR